MAKELQWLSPAQFQDRATKHPTALRGLGIYKGFAPEIKVGTPDSRTIRFRITTGTPDRDRDVINPAGWKLDEYLSNPVCLFAHSYVDLPVARAIQVIQDSDGLSAIAEFPTKDVYEFADTVYKMVKEGFLNATSVGFRPIEWTFNEERKGIDFMSQALLEFSICPIPANPECLVEARGMGIDLRPLKAWAEKTLDTWNGSSSLYIPREQAEAIVKIGSAMITVSAMQDPEKTAEPVIDAPAPEVIEIKSADGQQDPATEGLVLQDALTDGDAVAKRGRVLSAANSKLVMSLPRMTAKGKVELNGEDISSLLEGVEVSGMVGSLTRVVLHMLPENIQVNAETDKPIIAKRGRVLSAANESKLRQAAAMIADVVSQVDATPDSPSSGEAGDLENNAIIDIADKAQEGGLSIEEPEPIELPDDASASDGTLSINIDHDTLQRAVVETLRQSTASLGSLIERSVDAAVRRARGKVD